MRAIEMLQQGMKAREVAKQVGVTEGAVSQWKSACRSAGKEGLKSKPHPGRKPKLSASQRKRLGRMLLRGPLAHGFPTDLWTLRRVTQVIAREFGVKYHPGHTWRVLRSMNWSCQKPERQARERDEGAISGWRAKEWPRIKKARRSGKSIVFLDETGFMLQPIRRRTWAPRGKTPIQRSWDRHDRLSAISALTLAPQRRRLGLYFRMQRRNIVHSDICRFMVHIKRMLRRRIILVLDRWNVHRAAVRLLRQRFSSSFEVEWLPAYAPELNPVEYVWTNTKWAKLANFVPKDIGHLHKRVRGALKAVGSTTQILRSCFDHAKLKLE